MRSNTVIVTERKHKSALTIVVFMSLIQAICGQIVAKKNGMIIGKYFIFSCVSIQLGISCILYLISYKKLRNYSQNTSLQMPRSTKNISKIAAWYLCITLIYNFLPLLFFTVIKLTMKRLAPNRTDISRRSLDLFFYSLETSIVLDVDV